MTETKHFRLTPALKLLLQACVDAETTDTDVLAQRLQLSPATVKSAFKRINEALEVNSRSEALLVSLKCGLIHLATDANVSVWQEESE